MKITKKYEHTQDTHTRALDRESLYRKHLSDGGNKVGCPTFKTRTHAVSYVSDHLFEIPPQLKSSIATPLYWTILYFSNDLRPEPWVFQSILPIRTIHIMDQLNYISRTNVWNFILHITINNLWLEIIFRSGTNTSFLWQAIVFIRKSSQETAAITFVRQLRINLLINRINDFIYHRRKRFDHINLKYSLTIISVTRNSFIFLKDSNLLFYLF